jgi:uncharacterized protein
MALKSIQFFLLVFVLSIPFLILGMIVKGVTETLPIKLPISALMAFCPLIAAAILVYKKQKMQGVKDLLKQSFDFKKITDTRWYVPIVFLMPVLAMLSYWYKNEAVIPAKTHLSILTIPLFFIVFFIGAIGEELGWSGYIINPLQNQFGALKASIILGFLWAIWHIIPFNQAGQTAVWIFWQCLATIFLRIIMVWIFNNTGKSVFGMVLFHTMINLSPFLIPNNGAHYDPFIFCLLLMVVVAIVVFLWGSKILIGKQRTF